jgi:pimeloyl-ACP methyl ester carboxylesterase
MPTEKVNVGKFNISVRIEGEGKKGDIMLIHCLGLSNRVFDYQAKFLAELGWRVFLPDVRCHGESDKPEDECNIYDLTQDIEIVIKKIGIKKLYALGGISMGGMISMRLVLRNPNLTDKLILMGTSADEDPGKERFMPMILNLLQTVKNEKDPEVLRENFKNAAEYVVRLCFSPQYLEKDNNFDFWVSEALKSQGLGAIYVSKAVIERDSIIDKISSINVPTLIMAGANDMAVPVRESEKIAQRIKKSKLIIFDSAPHIFTPEIPDKVNAEMERFLSSKD